MGSMYVVLVDAYSKWLEVVIMNSITSISTMHELPITIVTDNGSHLRVQYLKSFRIVMVLGMLHLDFINLLLTD